MKDLFSDRFQMLKRAKARWGLLNCSWLCQNAQHCTVVLWAQLFSSFFLAAVGAPASNGLLHCFAQLPGGVGYAATTAVSSGWSWGAGCQNLCVNLCILLNVKWFKCLLFGVVLWGIVVCFFLLHVAFVPPILRAWLPLQSPTTLEF